MAAGQPPLKVLQVASSLYEWGGIERYVVFLAQGLEARGHSVTISCPSGSPISERWSRTVPIEVRRKFDFAALSAYLRLFRSDRFDVIHGHFSPDFTVPAYAAKLTKQPFTVMTRHVAKRWRAAKARGYLRLWDHIIPVSHAVERRLLEAGIPQSRMTVAKAGLPPPKTTKSRAEARADLGIAPDVLAIGSFGRLVEDKGIQVLIDAMPSVSGEAFIFGHGPYEGALKARAGDRVRFMGQVSDVADAMRAMDIVAIPSTWEEPFPYAALEAMALSRPIVASNIGGLPEMVEEGVNGRLFEAGNAGSLASVLQSWNASNFAAIGARGQARYEQEFTIEHMTDRIENVYRNVASASRR